MTKLSSSFTTSTGEILSPGLVKRPRVYGDTVGPSMTKQDFLPDCDINNILKNFVKSGHLPVSQRMPQYGDFSSAPDFQSALHIVIKAQEQFDSLDASVRKRFSNDPAEFLAFVSDPNNAEEAVKLGLADKPIPRVESETERLIKATSELNKTISDSSSGKK